MAIRQLDSLSINGTSYNLAKLYDIDSQISQYQGFPYQMFPGGASSEPSMISAVGTDFVTVMGSTWVTGDDEIIKNIDSKSAYLKQYYSNSLGTDAISLMCGNSEIYQDIYRSGNTMIVQMYLVLAVDDSTQKGYAFVIAHTNNGMWYGTAWTTGDSNLSNIYNALQDISTHVSNGGGASHVSKTTGLLSSLSQNISDILIVAGGGGGGGLTGTTPGNGGGYIGGSPKLGSTSITGRSGTQSTGYAFGQGEAGGGGGGFYGGLAAQSGVTGAGAGSGYIANSLLTGEKRMYGNNIPTSTDTDTYSISNGTSSSNPIAGYAKAGNGHVRFTYLREAEPIEGTYFFKPTFATGSDGHDTIRYNTNDRTYIFACNASYFLDWTPSHSTQPEKAYSGQLVDTYWPYPFSEAEKYDQLTIANNVLSLPGGVNALWNFGPVEAARECFPATCTITINFDFWLNQSSNDYSIADLIFFMNYEDESAINTTDGQGTIIYYGSSSDDKWIDFKNIYDDYDQSIITAQEWHNFKVVLQISNKEVTYADGYLDNLWYEHATDFDLGEFPNVIDGENKCCFIGFRPNIDNGIKIRDFYISYKPEQTMNLLDGQYFFKPTFASGTDGHDLARYNPSDQFYSVNNLNNISVGSVSLTELYPHHTQPTKLYAGQLTDMTWAYYDDQDVAHPYTNSNRFDEYTIGNNKIVISSTAYLSEDNALCWDFGPNMSQYKMIPRNCTITINCDMVANSIHFERSIANSYISLYSMYHETSADFDPVIHIGGYKGGYSSCSYDLTAYPYPFEGVGNIKNIITVENGQVQSCYYYVNDVLCRSSSYHYEFPNVIGGTLQCCAIIISGLCPEDEISNLYISVTPTN